MKANIESFEIEEQIDGNTTNSLYNRTINSNLDDEKVCIYDLFLFIKTFFSSI
jgi:hypothetical protein